MGWEVGKRYRGKAVAGEFAIKKIDKTGTRYVEGLVEVTMGPQLGERVRYRGYVNSERNAEATAGELRAMGCRSGKWGDWQGIGSREFSFVVMADEGQDGKTYFRATWARELATTSDRGKVAVGDLDDLNAQFGGAMTKAREGGAAPAPEPAPEGEEAIPF